MTIYKILPSLLLILLLLVISVPAQAATVEIALQEGFNFIVIPLSPTATFDTTTVLTDYSTLESIFRFDASKQEFVFTLKLSNGDLFGETFSLEGGKGYVINAKSVTTLPVVGDAVVGATSTSLVAGFNMVGFPEIGATPKASEILAAYFEVKSVFRWDVTTQNFGFVLRLDPYSTFGEDYTLAANQAYFVKSDRTSTLDFVNLAGGVAIPTLQTMAVTPDAPNLTIGITQNFTSTGTFTDSSTLDHSGKVTWSVTTVNGGFGTFSGATFTPTAIGQCTITATYNSISDNTVVNIIPVPAASDIVSGVNKLTMGTNGAYQPSAKNYQSSEEMVVILTENQTFNQSYSFTFTGGPSTAAPAFAPTPSKSYAVAPPVNDSIHSRMRATENLTARAFRQNGGYAGPSRAPSRAPTLGSTQQFWSLNSLSWPPTSTGYTDVNATCMGIGQHCYLFEDNNTPASYAKYPASAWAEITAAFDNDIYAKNIATFGSEPNPGVDGESKVYILFTYNVNAQRASGYFDSTNEMSVAEVAALGSTYKTNVKEILFMQVPTSTDTWAGLKHHVFGVMAHEFLHMIVYNQHVMLGGAQDNEEDWINEGLAQVAQDETGYGYQYGTLSFLMQPFLSDPEGYSLTNFQFSLGQYGMAYMYIRYLADQGYNL